MSGVGPDARAAQRLRILHGLARMKADQETARLAAVAQAKARLDAALAALSPAEPPLPAAAPLNTPIDPHLIRARLAHAAWTEAQRAQVNARLALVRADWLRLLPPAQAAFGRARVLGEMADAAAQAARRPRGAG